MAGGFAFGPQALLAATEEGDHALVEGFFERFTVHVAEHEYFVGGGVLDDRGEEAVAFIEIELVYLHDVAVSDLGRAKRCLTRDASGGLAPAKPNFVGRASFQLAV